MNPILLKSIGTKICIALICLSGLFISGCSSTLRLNVLQPATVYVHPEIKTIALVNRTKPMSKAANIVEGVLSGEGLFQDKSGVDNALGGLAAELHDSPRFKIVTTDLYITGSGAGHAFPNPLNWQEVENICRQYNADAICTIETYDSDTRIVPRRVVTKKKNSEGKEYDFVEFIADQTVTVQVGFRLYDPVDKTIVDQYHFTEQQNWSSRGATEVQAIGGLINKRAASDQVSKNAGIKYAIRIAPTWIWVTRDFYTRGGHDDMKQAGRLAKVNNWTEARKVWIGLLGAERKTAGKAAHNIAVSYEYEGNLQEAKKWADRAYSEFGNKRARSYSGVLTRRIRDVEILNKQMQGVDNK